MAARTHVDSSVGERRLRPIYDWLDIGNSKKALQEAEKVLKKQPNFQCAKVLKALALLRLGKEEECEQLLDVVRTEVPSDDSTLQAMTICYRETHKPERICEIYEAATRRDPSNEELLTHLFMAYVRVADYKKQHQTALALYKLKPKNPYYFWAVMSVVMQAYKADDKLAKNIVLPLAERMVAKFVKEGKIEAEQEVQLYLMILEMQGKYEEALEVVKGPLGDKLVSYVHVPLKKASLLMKLKRWHETNILFKLLLKENMDRWSYITEYLASSMNLFDSGQNNESNEVMNDIWNVADSSPEMCFKFLSFLSNENNSLPRRLRGPYLAHLELYKLLEERGDSPSLLLGDIVELLMAYFCNFSEKPCCVSDLKRFLPLLPQNRRKEFIEQVELEVGLKSGEMTVTANQMQQHICSVQLARCVGLHVDLSLEESRELLELLLRHYENGQQFNTHNLQTEFAGNDAYIVIASHVLHSAWVKSGDSSYLVEALALLERALACSPANFHFKLLLVRLYTLLGAGAAANRVYELLDVKHMQLDSLGYLHCSHIYATGQLVATSVLYESTLKFFTANYKDSVDHLTFSYKFGSFLKIEEFVEFRERLNNSVHYSVITVERMLLELLTCSSHGQSTQMIAGMEINPDKDKINWCNLQDNRDLTIMVSWEPENRHLSSDEVYKTFEDEIIFLRLRSLILRCIGAAFNCLSSSDHLSGQNHYHDNYNSNNNIMINGDQANNLPVCILSALIDELQCHYNEASSRKPVPLLEEVLNTPLPSRLFGYLRCPDYFTFLMGLFQLCCILGTARCGDDDARNAAELATSATDVASAAVKRVSKAIKEESEQTSVLIKRRHTMELCVITVEMLSIAVLLCGMCHNHLKPLSAPILKKSKKKKEVQTNAQVTAIPPSHQLLTLGKLIQDLGSCIEELSLSLEHWRQQQLALHLQALLNLQPEERIGTSADVQIVGARLADSHQEALSELLLLLGNKKKYLNALGV